MNSITCKEYSNIEYILEKEFLDDDPSEVLEETFMTEDKNAEVVEGQGIKSEEETIEEVDEVDETDSIDDVEETEEA